MEETTSGIEQAIEAFSKLPGVGKRTAFKLTMHLLRQPVIEGVRLGESILRLVQTVKRCRICQNFTDIDVCRICTDVTRNHSIICVVETIEDLHALEHTRQYRGVYHVLGGLINPMAGIGPGQLQIEKLEARLDHCQEIIMALNATIEGETTAYYLARLVPENVQITTLARGIPLGSELQYTDEMTLIRSLQNRTNYPRQYDL